MTKFHMTDDGPKSCSASQKPCPLGDVQHYTTFGEAQKDFEESQGKATPLSLKKERRWRGKQEWANEVAGKSITSLSSDYSVIDLDTGTVLGTNLYAVPYPSTEDELVELSSDSEAAWDYADREGDPLSASKPGMPSLEDSKKSFLVIDKETGALLGTSTLR